MSTDKFVELGFILILFKAHQACHYKISVVFAFDQDTQPIVISSEDIEVVIGSDEDEPGFQASETEELSPADRFSAFKGENI